MHRHIVGVFVPMCPSGDGAGRTGGNRRRFGVCFGFVQPLRASGASVTKLALMRWCQLTSAVRGCPARSVAGREKGTTIWDDAAGLARAPNDNATVSQCCKLISFYASEWVSEWLCVMWREVRRGGGKGKPFESKVDFPLFPVFCFCPSMFGHLLTSSQIIPITPTLCLSVCVCVGVQ